MPNLLEADAAMSMWSKARAATAFLAFSSSFPCAKAETPQLDERARLYEQMSEWMDGSIDRLDSGSY